MQTVTRSEEPVGPSIEHLRQDLRAEQQRLLIDSLNLDAFWRTAPADPDLVARLRAHAELLSRQHLAWLRAVEAFESAFGPLF